MNLTHGVKYAARLKGFGIKWLISIAQRPPYRHKIQAPFHVDYLFIVGEASHDSWVHNPVQQHGEWVYGKVGVVEVPLHHAADLLIGQLHRLHGVLQRADLLLCDPQNEVVTRRYSFTCLSSHCPHMHHYRLPNVSNQALAFYVQ